MTGDFNARHPLWGNTVTNQRGHYLKDWLDNNDITYKATLTGPCEPTFPESNSYLDLCINDMRLNILNLRNHKIPTFPYDSDHNRLKIKLRIPYNEGLIIEENEINNSINFSNTKWNLFYTKLLNHQFNFTIPTDVNLTNLEIEEYLDKVDETVLKMLKETTPPQKSFDSLARYVTKEKKFTKKLKVTYNHKYIDWKIK